MTPHMPDDDIEQPGGDSVESSELPAMVPVNQIAAHPANPRRVFRQQPLEELTASIAAQGILEPLVVLPAGRVAALWPEHADNLSDAAWVVLSGHRRRLAAQRVYRSEPDRPVPVWIRRDAICDDRLAQLDAMFAGNIARVPLTALEEARAFAGAVEAGRSQRQIARICGCSQSHVSKRLALLRLPPDLQEALDHNHISVRDALAISDLEDARQMLEVWRLLSNQREFRWIKSVRGAIEYLGRVRELEVRQARAQQQAEAEGVELVDAVRLFGHRREQHRVSGTDELKRARADDSLRAYIGEDGNLEYYTIKPAAQRPAAGRAGQERDAWRGAGRYRERAATELVSRPPELPEWAGDIVDSVLAAASRDVRHLARRWLSHLNVGSPPDTEDGEWWRYIYRADWPTRVLAAHAISLARYELCVRAHRTGWDSRDAAWVNRLIDVGYVPTQWEQDRLRELEAAKARGSDG